MEIFPIHLELDRLIGVLGSGWIPPGYPPPPFKSKEEADAFLHQIMRHLPPDAILLPYESQPNLAAGQPVSLNTQGQIVCYGIVLSVTAPRRDGSQFGDNWYLVIELTRWAENDLGFGGGQN